jgi:probable HAF family extracellular repeat protein
LLLAAPVSATPATFQVIAQNFFAGAPAVSADGSSAFTYVSGSSGQPSVSRWKNGVSTFVTNGDFIFWGGLSADGSVLVGGRDPIGAAPQEAFRWQNGVYTPLGSGTTVARDISADASTIVGYGTSGAFMHQGGTVTWLGDLPDGGSSSEASAVNGDGSVVVGWGTSASGTEAFRWVGGSMQGLGDLAGGGFESVAQDVSQDGGVVIGWGTSASGHEAFRWESGAMTGLGLLDGTYQTRAGGISGDGSVIVGEAITVPHPTYDSLSEKVAVIWDATGMHVLQDWLLQQFGLDLSDYQLRAAFDVSSDGRTIVGEGYYYPGTSGPQRIGWVVTIPEPETAPLLCFGLIAVTAVQRRRRSCASRSAPLPSIASSPGSGITQSPFCTFGYSAGQWLAVGPAS